MLQRLGRKIISLIRVGRASSIYRSVLIYFILFALIPTGVFLLFFNSTYSNFMDNTMRRLGNEILDNATSSLNDYFNSVVRLGNMAADNPRIQDALRMDFQGDVALKFSTDLQMDTELYFANYAQPDIAGLSILGENGGEYKSSYRAFLTQDHTAQTWYKEINETRNYTWFPPHRMQFANVSDVANESFITCGKPVINNATGEISGVLLIDIHEDTVRNILMSDLQGLGYILILDEANNVIVSSSSEKGSITEGQSFELLQDESFSSRLRITHGGKSSTQQVLVTKYAELNNGWRVIGFLPTQQLSGQGTPLITLTIVIAVLIVGFAILISYRVANSVLKPVNNLRTAMKEVEEGNFDVSTEVDSGYSEVNQLSKSFSVMVEKTKELMEKTYQDQKKLRISEFQILQSNINPHFLYNTLDSILWLNRSNRKNDIETIVASLTNFFRIGLSRGRAIITMEDEVKHLESYLKIQSLRYGKKFEYVTVLDESVRDFNVPKLILQPLAENAIYHGIKLKEEPGQIITTISKSNGNIVIKMKDTGIGIKDDRLEELNLAMQGTTDKDFNLFGTRNAYDRLRILFGENVSMVFSSEYGEYTEVVITVPDIMLEEQD